MSILDLSEGAVKAGPVSRLRWCGDDDLDVHVTDEGLVAISDSDQGGDFHLEINSALEAEALIRCLQKSIDLGWYR